ncbi:MAG: cytochrome c3 family protein [Acidiferrobacterales bacterium]|nr:cytochrome c3 family protein [Acidiferrobacterales bacterium]
MKIWALTVVTAALIAVISGVSAAPPGQDLQWKAPMGVVTFSGQVHANAGLQCTDCHDVTGGKGGIFQMKYGTAKQTMAQMNEGKGCGTCHNGKKAFATSDPKSCTRCHQAK